MSLAIGVAHNLALTISLGSKSTSGLLSLCSKFFSETQQRFRDKRQQRFIARSCQRTPECVYYKGTNILPYISRFRPWWTCSRCSFRAVVLPCCMLSIFRALNSQQKRCERRLHGETLAVCVRQRERERDWEGERCDFIQCDKREYLKLNTNKIAFHLSCSPVIPLKSPR